MNDDLIVKFSTGKSDVSREFIFTLQGMDFTFLSKNKPSRNNMSSDNESDSATVTYLKIVEQLNHMIWYFKKNPNILNNNTSAIDKFIHVILQMEAKSKEFEMEKAALNRYRITQSMSLVYHKQHYFKTEVIERCLLNNVDFLRCMYLYILNNTDLDLEVKDNMATLTIPDVMCLLMSSLFMRFLFIFHTRVNDILQYKRLVKEYIPSLCALVDEFNKEYLDQSMGKYMVHGFSDRLFAYVSGYLASKLKSNEALIQKFKALGENEMSIKLACIQSIQDSMVRYCMYNDDSSKMSTVLNIHPDRSYYPSRNLAAYISSTVDNTSENKIKLAKPRFISNVISSKSDDNEDARSSKAAKFEVMLEKQNKEVYDDMVDIRDTIVDIEWDKLNIEQKNLVGQILSQNHYERHLLGEFMVSKFLESEYGENIINYLNGKQYVIIAMRVAFRLARYPDLSCSILSKIMGSQNNVVFDMSGLEKLPIYSVNPERVIKIFTDIVKNNYVSKYDNIYTTHNVASDFRKFLLDGVRF
ncbi:MAG: hypothetical protein ACRCZ9_12065 [Fusobacteriaceae bacterium]